MQAIQLSLWGGESQTATPSHTLDLGVCPRNENENTLTLDPCRGCPLCEVCAPEDCGMKLYDIDVSEPESQDFEDWLSDPL